MVVTRAEASKRAAMDIITRITREVTVDSDYIKINRIESLDNTIVGKGRWIKIVY
jgi:hypothetical protein